MEMAIICASQNNEDSKSITMSQSFTLTVKSENGIERKVHITVMSSRWDFYHMTTESGAGSWEINERDGINPSYKHFMSYQKSHILSRDSRKLIAKQ